MKGQRARPVGDASAAKKRRTWRGGRPESDEGEERSAAAAARRHEDRVDGGKKAARNALRSAQLEKRELLLFRKFGYGPRLFSRYYREQRLASAEELRRVSSAFATTLPITFRLHATDPRAASFATRLDALAARGLVCPLPWMPPGQGWQALGAGGDADAGRERLHPDVSRVVEEGVGVGLLARQEAVSMLPVLVLAPTLAPGARVLDVCAAPGNKTMQLLEMVSPPGVDGGAAGVVVANDAHPRRVDTLREAIARHKRRNEEMESLIVTCAMGQDVPVPEFEDGRGFHAVLADVPCSGDGTLRKDPDVLRRWHPGAGNALHLTQVAVARRAASLVRPGGHLLYSTCSLNPVEDEAVVAAILEGPGGDEFELVDGACDRGAPGVRYRPGTRDWGVAEHATRGDARTERTRGKIGTARRATDDASSEEDDSDSEEDEDVSLRWYASYDDARAAGMPAAAPTMWPPTSPSRNLHLERCARFLPHDQDTGGFFVALLRRRSAASKSRGKAGAGAGADADADADAAAAKRRRAKAAAAARAAADLPDPVRPLPHGEPAAIASQLGLNASTRARLWLGAKGAVTLAPPAVADVSSLGGVAIAAAGVVALVPRVLAWDENEDAGGGFPYDFTAAGAEALARVAKKRRVRAAPTDLQAMLAARASGIDRTDGDEVVCLTPDEMSEATRRRWEEGATRGAVIFVLLKRADREGDAPKVAFAVAGRCTEDGLTLSPEVTAEEARRLLARLSDVAGTKRRERK